LAAAGTEAVECIGNEAPLEQRLAAVVGATQIQQRND